MSARAAGFTLVEAVIVMTLLGILAWVAYPKLTATGEIRLDAAARRVAADLRYAQSRAIGTRVVHGLLFETGANRYTVYAPTVATPAVDPGDRAKPLRVDFARRTEYKGVTLVSATFGATSGVSFDYFGVPRDTSGVDLAASGRVVLTYQGLSDTVLVAPGTGKVTVK
ncbi:MAG TPA: prepilin-type N-terminal cleavage/methylation domain-containing protein [Candidatus Eisenbacteria bacterium]